MSRWMPWPSTTSTMHAKRALSQNGTRRRARGIEPVVVGGAGWLTRLTQTSEGGPSERRRRGRRADVGVPDRAGAS